MPVSTQQRRQHWLHSPVPAALYDVSSCVSPADEPKDCGPGTLSLTGQADPACSLLSERPCRRPLS